MQGTQNGNLFIVVAKKKLQILVIILQGVENEYFFHSGLGKAISTWFKVVYLVL